LVLGRFMLSIDVTPFGFDREKRQGGIPPCFCAKYRKQIILVWTCGARVGPNPYFSGLVAAKSSIDLG
jgi:hypothetical protein